MTERVIATRFTADVNSYVRGVNDATRATRDQAQASTDVGTAMLAMGTVAAVGIGIAVAKFAEFDQAISNVKAATQESTENMGLLREAALEAGASSVFSATEAANAIEELGKAGLTTQQILNGGLDGALSLAAAGAIGVAEAAGIAAITVKQFNLAGADVPHVADLLAAGAGKAVGDVTDLAAALGQAGLVANSTGLSVEETTGVLAAFADKGLLGSDAGTSLKTMLQSLVPSSAAAREEMERLGISAYDANGQFIGAAAFAGNYQNALKDLTPEQQSATSKIIFGSDAVRAANVFYELGAEGIGKYIDQTNDSGYAAKVAADRLNNLSGDVEALGGAFDTYMIKSGSGANDMLRTLTQGATGLISAVGALPEPVLGGSLAIGGLVTVVALAGGTALVAIPKLAAFKLSLQTLNVSGRTAAIGVGALAGGLAVAGIAFSMFAEKQAKAASAAQAYEGSLDSLTGSVTSYSRELASAALSEQDSFLFKTDDSAYDAAEKLGIGLDLLTEAAVGSAPALKNVKKQLQDLTDSMGDGTYIEEAKKRGLSTTEYEEAILKTKDALKKQEDALKRGKTTWEQKQKATEGDTGATEASTAATEASTVATEAATEASAKYLAGIAEQDAAFINISGALDVFTEDVKLSVDAYLAELQTMVDAQNNWESNMILLAGKVSQGVLDELANMGPEGAPLVAELVNASTEQLATLEGQFAEKAANATGAFASTLTDAKSVIDAAAAQLGQDAANEIAGKLAAGTSTVEQIMTDYGIKIESINPTVRVSADTDAAYASLEALAARARTIRDLVNASNVSDGTAGNGLGIIKKATGGAISGPGTGTSDSIPARLSNGEHVLTAEDVRAMGGQGGVYAFRRDLYQGFAKGGAVRYSSAPAGGGNSSSSVTNRNVNQTWNVTSNGDDPSTLAAKIDGQVNWSMRGLS